jgi:purine-binding chemotaxis protein CheW
MANSPTLHAVIFRIGALICAAPAGIVREILPRLPATRIPGVAQAVEGLVNVRGTLLTVLDGHVLLQQPREAADEGAIVVVEVGGRRYGLGVGQVVDFLEVPERSVAPRTDLPGIDPRLVLAVGIRDGQHFILLDIDALFAPIIGTDGPPGRRSDGA